MRLLSKKKALARAAAAVMATSIIASAALPALAEGAPTEEPAPLAAVEEAAEVQTEAVPSTDVDTAAREEPVTVAAEEEAPSTDVDTATLEELVAEEEAAPVQEVDAVAPEVDAAPAENSAAEKSSPTDATAPELPLDNKVIVGAGETKELNGNCNFTKPNGGFEASKGGSITVNGNVSGGSVSTYTTTNGSITINGNVSSKEGGQAVFATEGGSITVNGNITGGNGVLLYDSKTKVVVTGDVTTSTSNLTKPEYGIVFVFEGGTAEIGGNVINTTVPGSGINSTGVSVNKGGTVSVGGNVKANSIGAAAIVGKVTIKGNVEAPDKALYLGKKDSSILVGGDISSSGKKVVIDAARSQNVDGSVNEIAIGGKIKNAGNSEGASLSVDMNNLPEFVVGEIEAVNKFSITDGDGKALSETDRKKVMDNIKYVVHYADKTEDGQAAITVTKNDGSAFDKDSSGTYEVAKKGEEIKVKVQTIPGWVAQILPGKDNTVRENGDGTYTVTVADGGGIDIRAVLKQIVTPPVKPPVTPVTPTEDEGENAVEAWLYVVGKDGSRVPYTQEQKGDVMVFTTTEEDAALTGNLLALEELEVPTVQFVTPHKTSTFTVSTVCSAGSENDVFVLAHDKASSTLFAGNAVHNEYLS